MGTVGCINDMLQRDKENRELRKRNRERLTDTYHRLLDSEKNTDLSQMTIEKMEDIRRKTLEKEEPDKVSAFKIMLYYATGAALLVIPDWLPMKSTARHQENGRCHMAGNRSDSLSLEPVVTLKDFTDILLCQSFFKSKYSKRVFKGSSCGIS